MFNPLFEREETHADYTAWTVESSDDDDDFEDAENKRYKFEFKHQIRRKENKERLEKLREYQEMGRKAWIQQKKQEKLEKAQARGETAEQGRGKKGKGKYAKNFSYNVFAREKKKNIDKTRPTCKRVRENDIQDNVVKSKSVKTQTEVKSKSVKTQANMTSEEEDASVPNDQKKITEYFTVLGSKTREKQVSSNRG